ncbi:MarR family winged helix-turn-helix transcriptional regulator [Pseudodesulfovibrio cashew]|nr:MarR family transcriptional regulator [Pseudodesulfovibrio cashew]
MNKDEQHMLPQRDVAEFQDLIESLFQCCRERQQYQSERFGLPDAELRCLLLFRNERYLTAKSIAERLHVAKSRVTKIVSSLVRKDFVESTDDPVDSRVKLLSLTRSGEKLLAEVLTFHSEVHRAILGRFTDEQRAMLLGSMSLLGRHMKSVRDLME